MKLALYGACSIGVCCMAVGVGASGQQTAAEPTPLATLVAEAQQRNANIAAADHAWQAAAHVAQQVTTLPDPQLTVQSLSVGSPRPLAGFSNSNFAYIGFGASQELPYAGKLRLKGEIAHRDADVQEAQAGLLRNQITDQVKLDYLRLAYVQATLDLLAQSDAVLRPTIETALSRYSVGQGSQAEVLRAQIERTKTLREMTKWHQEAGQTQAGLKELLHRPQASADIVPEPLQATPLRQTADELHGLVLSNDPAITVSTADVQEEDARLKSAKRDGKPDFNVGYMFQKTGLSYSDYYMLTISMNLPRHKRVEAGIAQAAESVARAKDELDAQQQAQLEEVQKQYVAVRATEELLKEYVDGLLPQARAVLQAERANYQAGREALAPVLSAELDVLSAEQEYEQALLDHETAMARLETLTGAQLR